MHGESEALTEREAQAVAREWVDNTIEKPARSFSASQTRWLMSDLASFCIAESLRNQECEDQLCERLNAAWDILHGIWYESAPEFAKRVRWRDEEKPDEVEQERIDASRHIIWARRDPRRSFEEGFESEHHTSFDRDSLKSIAAKYLSKPWLRHPVVDWIFVDMLVSCEICAFGEVLKQKSLPGRRDFLEIHHKYFRTKGNLAKMTSIDWSDVVERIYSRFLWMICAPIATIWAAFHFGYTQTGTVILAVYACIAAIYFSVKIFGWSKRIVLRMLGRADPRIKPFLLWDQMYEVWRRLDGPVVNPMRVRDAMVKSAEVGAVWDEATWSLIDRVVAVDSTAWVIQPSR